MVAVARGQVHPVGRAAQNDALEAVEGGARHRVSGGRGKRQAGGRSGGRLRSRGLGLLGGLGRLLRGALRLGRLELLGRHVRELLGAALLLLRRGHARSGGAAVSLAVRGGRLLVRGSGLGLLRGATRLHGGDLGGLLLGRQVGPGVLARLLGRRSVAVRGGSRTAVRVRDDGGRGRARGGHDLLAVLPVLPARGLLGHLWGGPRGAAGEDVRLGPRAEVAVLLLQGRAEHLALLAEALALEARLTEDLADTRGEEQPRRGRALDLLHARVGALGLGLALLLGRAAARRAHRGALGGDEALQSGDAAVEPLQLGEDEGEGGVDVGGRHFGSWESEGQGESVPFFRAFNHSILH